MNTNCEVVSSNLWLQRAEFGRRGVERLARLQPQHDPQPRRIVVVGNVRTNHRLYLDGKKEVERQADFHAEEPSGEDANNRDGNAFDDEGPADHSRNAAKVPLPERIADHCRRTVRTTARDIVSQRERTTEKRRHTQCGEEIAADPFCVHRLGIPVDRQRGVDPRQRAVERLAVLPDLVEGRVAVRRSLARLQARGHGDETLWMCDRQHSQQQAVDERKDRSVGADAECQRQDGSGGEAWIHAKSPQRIADVVCQPIDEGHPPGG